MDTRDKLDFIKVGEFGYFLRQWQVNALDEVYITRAELAELVRVALDDLLQNE